MRNLVPNHSIEGLDKCCLKSAEVSGPPLQSPGIQMNTVQLGSAVAVSPPTSAIPDKATQFADGEMLNSKHFGLSQMWLNYLNVFKQSAMSK